MDSIEILAITEKEDESRTHARTYVCMYVNLWLTFRLMMLGNADPLIKLSCRVRDTKMVVLSCMLITLSAKKGLPGGGGAREG